MSLPTPNFILNESHTISLSNFDSKVLEEGTFARPLSIEYVPKHIKDMHKWFNPEFETYCYTPIGIIPIPTRKLSQI